jgi:hypothetical protein
MTFYLPTRLAGYSVNSGISCGARKLTRTPRIKKKKLHKWSAFIAENWGQKKKTKSKCAIM